MDKDTLDKANELNGKIREIEIAIVCKEEDKKSLYTDITGIIKKSSCWPGFMGMSDAIVFPAKEVSPLIGKIETILKDACAKELAKLKAELEAL